MRDLELIRAYVDATMPAEERAAFEARLAGDPALAQLAEAYDLVVRATACRPPARRSTFADLPLRRRSPVRWAAAAALLLAVGLAFVLRDKAPDPPPPALRLASIPLRPVEAPDVPAWPAALASVRTADERGLAWLDDESAAKDLARISGRPLLVFVHHPQCPLCRAYERGPFRDADVAAAAESFVLLEVNVERMPAWIAREMPSGWPVFLVDDPGGERLSVMTGFHGAPEVARWLGRVSAGLREGKRFRFADWRTLRDAARKLQRAERAGPAERLRLWQDVERDLPGEPLGEVARASRLQMEAAAQAALFAARAAESARSTAILDAAAHELEGTPYAADLARVAEHVRRYGSFPEIE